MQVSDTAQDLDGDMANKSIANKSIVQIKEIINFFIQPICESGTSGTSYALWGLS